LADLLVARDRRWDRARGAFGAGARAAGWLVLAVAIAAAGAWCALALAMSGPYSIAMRYTLAAASGGVAFGLLASVAPWLRLAAGLMLLGTVYLGLLLFAMGQRTLYLEVLRGLRTPATP